MDYKALMDAKKAEDAIKESKVSLTKKIEEALELIQAFEHEDAFLKESSSHILYRSLMNMNDLIKEIKKTLS